MLQNLSSAAVVIGALRVKFYFCEIFQAEQVLLKLRGTNRVDKELSGIRVSIASEKV